jgi:hypothetical protein
MEGDALEPVRYIGERLRSWRHERDWSGPEAAVELAARLGRAVEWPELRSYEESAVLPNTPTASHLAAVYGRRLADLLTLGRPVPTSAVEPWPPTIPSTADLEAAERLLADRNHDPRHAARLFELGLSKGSIAAWLRKFGPEDAFDWIAVRFGPREARQWADRGYSAQEAVDLKALGFRPDSSPPPAAGRTTGNPTPIEVTTLLNALHLSGDEISPWIDAGWDLLESVPWQLLEFDACLAQSWRDAGFDAQLAAELKTSLSPSEATDWRATMLAPESWGSWRAARFTASDAIEFVTAGFDVDEARAWRDAGFGPSEARVLTHVGFDPGESSRWRDAGFEIAEASDYRRLGLDTDAALPWRAAGVRSSDVQQWLDLGLRPADAQQWRDVTTDPAEIAAAAAAGLSPEQVAQYAEVGVRGKDVEHWHRAGFDPAAAGPWAGTSPERAHRLISRGITAEFDRSRRAVGAQRVAAARDSLAERRKGSQGTATTGTAGAATSLTPDRDSVPFSLGCRACGKPIGPTGRCGCS